MHLAKNTNPACKPIRSEDTMSSSTGSAHMYSTDNPNRVYFHAAETVSFFSLVVFVAT